MDEKMTKIQEECLVKKNQNRSLVSIDLKICFQSNEKEICINCEGFLELQKAKKIENYQPNIYKSQKLMIYDRTNISENSCQQNGDYQDKLQTSEIFDRDSRSQSKLTDNNIMILSLKETPSIENSQISKVQLNNSIPESQLDTQFTIRDEEIFPNQYLGNFQCFCQDQLEQCQEKPNLDLSQVSDQEMDECKVGFCNFPLNELNENQAEVTTNLEFISRNQAINRSQLKTYNLQQQLLQLKILNSQNQHFFDQNQIILDNQLLLKDSDLIEIKKYQNTDQKQRYNFSNSFGKLMKIFEIKNVKQLTNTQKIINKNMQIYKQMKIDKIMFQLNGCIRNDQISDWHFWITD